jgi:hypothetical protein
MTNTDSVSHLPDDQLVELYDDVARMHCHTQSEADYREDMLEIIYAELMSRGVSW